MINRFTIAVIIVLLCSSSGFSASPVIDSVTVSPVAVAPGGAATITVQAHDPDCTAGSCTNTSCKVINSANTAWSVSAGTIAATNNGSNTSPYTASIDWQAPAVGGNYTVTVTVWDKGSGMLGCPSTSGSSTETIVVGIMNNPPVISSLTGYRRGAAWSPG